MLHSKPQHIVPVKKKALAEEDFFWLSIGSLRFQEVKRKIVVVTAARLLFTGPDLRAGLIMVFPGMGLSSSFLTFGLPGGARFADGAERIEEPQDFPAVLDPKSGHGLFFPAD